jgi:hypothetical protein
VISSIAVLELKAADMFIVGILSSIAVRLSTMQDQKLFTLL